MNEAYLRVYKNKGASGVDGVTVDELKQYLKENKDELRQRIMAMVSGSDKRQNCLFVSVANTILIKKS
jgi:hypothetical protein